ncbi:hypothetical protein TgHK011_008456 [Trichoderma gracile]|nr:hypothetical protein TgHK011_008456 [Trichoderma gracile]
MLILESRSITLWEHFYLRSMLGRSDGLVSLQSALNPHSADAVHKTSIHAFAQSARIGSGQGSSYTGMVTINGGAVHVKQLPIGTSQAFPVSFNRAANTKLLTLKYESFCCVHTYWVCHATRGSEATNATICSILRGGCEHRVEERSLYLKIQGQPPAESTARSIVQVWCVSMETTRISTAKGAWGVYGRGVQKVIRQMQTEQLLPRDKITCLQYSIAVGLGHRQQRAARATFWRRADLGQVPSDYESAKSPQMSGARNVAGREAYCWCQ